LTGPQARLPRQKRPQIAIIVSMIALMTMITISHQRSRAKAAQQAREAAVRADLAAMRNAIRTYHANHQANPASLDDLVRDGELRAIPADPLTSSKKTWRPTFEESVRVDDFQTGAARPRPTISDVHSGAAGRDSSGKAFADY
jgi:general secretion pathway protein G